MAAANSGWSSVDFSPLMELVLPMHHGQFENLLRQSRDVRHARAAAAEKNSGTQIIAASPALSTSCATSSKHFLQPQAHDAAQMFEIDGLAGGSPSSLVMVMRLAFDRVVHERRAVFELQLLRAAQRHFQADGQIVA